MGLRLAGRGLGMLAKPGIGGKIARGIGGTALTAGAFEAAPSVYGLATGDAIKSAQDEILQQGTTDGTYDINFGNQLKSTISGAFGGKTIDDASLAVRKKQKNTYSLLEDPKNALFKKQLLGIGVNPEDVAGDSVLGLQAKYSDDIASAKRKKLFAEGQDEYRNSQAYLDAVTEREYNKGVQETARGDRLTREKQARLDSIDNREASYAQAMADLDFKKGQSNRDYDFRTKELEYNAAIKKDARRAKILAALGGLGMMFAS